MVCVHATGLPLGIEACREMVVPHRAIPAAAKIVFARPDDFHGNFRGFGDFGGFGDEIGCRIGAPAESSAQ